MPITVTLDPDVAERIEQEVRRAGKPAQTVVNEALRTRLGLKTEPRSPDAFRVQAHDFGFAAGLDLDKMNRLVDDLEAAAGAQRIRLIVHPTRTSATRAQCVLSRKSSKKLSSTS
jgi:hypothetical protein